MRVKEFVDLVNAMDCEEFSDIPEDNVEFVKSRVNEVWAFDDSYSTAMNVYKCEDGYAGVIGLCHLNDFYYDCHPEKLASLPHCVAVEVTKANVPTFVPNPNNVYTNFVNKHNLVIM